MAKGAQAKEELFNKLQEIFPNSFFDDKVLRIPWVENGEQIELKVALTCAKDVIGGNSGSMLSKSSSTSIAPASAFDNPEPEKVKVTADEAANVSKLLKELGL